MIDAGQVWQFLEDHAEELSRSSDEFLQERDRLRRSVKPHAAVRPPTSKPRSSFPTGKHGAYPSSDWTPGIGDWLPFETRTAP